MRINKGQEFVVGGYTAAGRTFDALIFGYYEGDSVKCETGKVNLTLAMRL